MKITEIETKSLKQFLESISQTPNSSYNLSNLFSVVNKGEKSYFNLSKTINFTNIAQIPEKYILYIKYNMVIHGLIFHIEHMELLKLGG